MMLPRPANPAVNSRLYMSKHDGITNLLVRVQTKPINVVHSDPHWQPVTSPSL
jgi:hypothetical protein